MRLIWRSELCLSLPDIKAQVVYAVRTEMAHTIGDICRRRTMLSLQANYGLDALETISQTLQAHCGWRGGSMRAGDR